MLLFKHLQVKITVRGQFSGVNCPGVKSTPPCRILLIRGIIHAIIKLIYKYLIK